ncbi:immunity protein Imm33 domain-containing protein [Massilia horti]|uniref:DUF2185 domain-containing protein n=1 Tax=Massilia horti TaxID=2562153 RepID=A0A4Y9SQR5_9BURK|nr:DUF2185 domain-containing protein [Massilia horti]TFW28878.1 DUF2185 domain-containing protein [Massilia horti]
MENQSWWLTDAAESQRHYPYTFYKPSKATISKLHVGSLVKLIFEFDQPDPDGLSAERMWVTLTEIDGDRFKGELDNEPFYLKTLKLGDPVEFEERHIIQTDLDEVERDTVKKYRPRCFVTRKVLYDGEKAGYIYREEPEEDDDSGWRIMAGNESDQYLDDQENVLYVSLGAVLNQDDSFAHLLGSAPGVAFQRDLKTGEFKTKE